MKLDKTELKNISIVDYLYSKGFEPEKIKNGRTWFKGVFIDGQKTGSFNVSLQKNEWHDFSTGEGGDIIALVMKLENLSFRDATNKLYELFKDHSYDNKTISSSFTEEVSSLRLHNEKPFGNNESLVRYATLIRRIKYVVAMNYLREVYFYRGNKHMWGLALKQPNQSEGINISCGFKMNNKFFKTIIGSNDCTLIPGNPDWGFAIFEGFWDFLSALTFYNVPLTQKNIIVLNSTANLQKAVAILQERQPSRIDVYLDQDLAGVKARMQLEGKFEIKDCSNLYNGYKDFNEMLMKRKFVV